MTNEQWILYLYGIYPSGGISLLVFMVCFFAWIIYIIDGLVYKNDKRNEININKENYFHTKMPMKLITIITIIVLTIGNFVPKKEIFLAMIATPILIENMKDGKLSKINKLIDGALDLAIEKIEEQK